MSKSPVMELERRDVHRKVLVSAFHRACLLFPDDPVIKSAYGACRAQQWGRLIEHAESLEIQQYSGVLDQYVKTQLVALVKKFPWLPDELPGFDPEQTAMEKFLAAEHRCKRVNQRSRLLRYGVGFAYGEVLSLSKSWIRSIIGRKPDLERIYDLCDWGPGANVGVIGDRTSFARKFLSKTWTVTPLALSYATSALWSNHQLRMILLDEGRPQVCLDREKFSALVKARVALVSHNNISFVPKTYKTHRSIASEPLLNGYLQKGIDQFMRHRLRAAGIDLDLKHQEPNQLMARQGSLGGFNPYVTIDLSAASDSLSIGCAKTLLPSEWYELLDSCRSHRYRYRGVEKTYEKFVSMGNGFCFPLQTLIFASVCYACSVIDGQPADFRVYGDDIIVRQSTALRVLEVLRYLGFRNNPDKTFIFGPFRESCGADWYSGLDIRPVYMDFRLDTNVDLYKFHNSTLRSGLTFDFFAGVRESLREYCPPEVRFVRPIHGNPDAAFTVARDEAMSSKYVSWNRRLYAWRWKEVENTSVRDMLYPFTQVCSVLEYLSVLRGASSSCPAAIRRKTRAAIVTKSQSGIPGDIPWRYAGASRGETPL